MIGIITEGGRVGERTAEPEPPWHGRALQRILHLDGGCYADSSSDDEPASGDSRRHSCRRSTTALPPIPTAAGTPTC